MIFVENSWFPPIAKILNPFKFGRRYFQSVFVCVCVCVYENSFFFIQRYFPATLSLLLWISGHRAYFDFIFVYVHHLYFYF